MNSPAELRSDEPYLTRASMFGQLASPRRAERDAAWAAFRARYAPMIAGFARRCGASPQDVDDLIQDVMTAFVTAADAFVYDPAKGRFRGWLKTCTVRIAIRRAGKSFRFQGVPLEDVPEVEAAVDPMWNDIWARETLQQAIVRLRERHGNDSNFRAFEQYVLRDRDAASVAAELGISIDRVYQAKTRLTRELRDAIDAVDD